MSFSGKAAAATNSPSPAGIEANDLATNEEAVPVRYHVGEDWCELTWLIPDPLNVVSKDVKQTTGKQETTTGHESWVDVAGLVCIGLSDAVTGFEVDGLVTWEGNVARPDDTAHPDYWRAHIHTAEAEMYYYWGRPDQPRDDILLGPLTTAYPDIGHPAYQNQSYVVLVKYYQGTNASSVRNTRVRVRRSPKPAIGSWPIQNSPQGESLVGAILELATDPIFGAGLSTDAFPASEYEALSAKVITSIGCHTPFLDRAQPFRDVVRDFCTYFDGFFRIRNGKIHPGMYPHDGVVPAGLTTLDMHDFMGFPNVDGAGPSDAVNVVWVMYRDRTDAWKKKPAKGSDSADIKARRTTVPVIIEMLGMIDGNQAKRYAAEAAATASEGVWEGDGTVRQARLKRLDGTALEAGDNFIFDCAVLQVNQIGRIKRRTDPFRGSPSIDFIAEKGMFPAPYAPPVDDRPIPADPIPLNIPRARIYEATRELVKTSAKVGLAIIAQRPHSVAPGAYALTGKDVYRFQGHISADNTVFDQFYDGRHWGIFGAVREALAGAGADVTVKLTLTADNLDLDRLSPQSIEGQANDTLLIIIGEELFSVRDIAISGLNYDFSCKRARQGSVYSAHGVGADAWIMYRDEIDLVDSLQVAGSQVRYFKLQPFTHRMGLPLAETSVVTYTFGDRNPVAPTGVSAIAGTGKIISISWSIDVPLHVAEFSVWRAETNDSSTATQIGLVRGTRFIDVDLVFATTYHYWIKSISDRGDSSDFSSGVSAAAVAAVGPQGPQGDPGPAGDHMAYVFKRASYPPSAPNSTPTGGGMPIPENGIPSGWSDAPPAGTAPLWMATTRQHADGTSLFPWGVLRFDADSAFIEYSVDGSTAWHSGFVDGDLFMRQKVGADAAWSEAIRIVGEAGNTSYFHVAYADSSDGATNFNQISGAYIGTYVDFTAADSTDHTHYVWRLIKGLQGDQGVPGNNGSNGQTSYLHIKYSNDGGTTFTGHSGEDVGAWIGTVVDFNASDPTTVGAYSWAQVTGYKDSTPPNDPANPTIDSGDTYNVSDGGVRAWVRIDLPAMPSGAETMNLLYRRTGSPGWIVAGQVASGGVTSEIDGLSPGASYQYAVQAYSAYGKPSAVVLGSPSSGIFTAPTKGVRPSAPTGFTTAAPAIGDGFPVAYLVTHTLVPGAWLIPPAPDILDAATFEWRVQSIYTPTDDIAVSIAESAPVGTRRVPIYTSPSAYGARVFVRWNDRSGLRGHWSAGISVSWSGGYAGNIGIQDSDDLTLSGITTSQSGSGTKYLATGSAENVYVATASAAEQRFYVPISNFTFKPKGLIGGCVSNIGWDLRYDWDDSGNSSTQACLVVTRPDGAVIPVGTTIRYFASFYNSA